MKLTFRLGASLVLIASALLTSTLPANAVASTTTIWSTSSTNKWVGVADDPKVAVNGSVKAVAWLTRLNADSHSLNVRVMRDGVWGQTETLFTNENDWWSAFDVEVSNSGTVYVGYSTGDVNLTVFTSSVAGTWTNVVADSTFSLLGAMRLSGVTDGSTVTFTTNRSASNRAMTISASSFSEANPSNGWVTKVAHDFTPADFSACTIRRGYYDSCALTMGAIEIATDASGAQLMLVNLSRDSANGYPAGTQFKLFKYHRASATADWVSDGSFATLTLPAGASGYSYFVDLAVTPLGKYAVSLVTGSSKNTLRLYTGVTFDAAPVQVDAAQIAKYKNTDAATLGVIGEDFYTAFDANQGTHKFGLVGSLATTIRNLSFLKNGQDTKGLMAVDGKLVLIVQAGHSSTYVSTCTLTANICAWTPASKISSYSQDYTYRDAVHATDGNSYAVMTSKFTGKRVTGIYAYTN